MCKRGEQKQAVGRSRGGRNTKIHGLADAKRCLIAILLTGGQAHDCPIAERLIPGVKRPKRMIGDKPMTAPNCARDWMRAEPNPPFPIAATGSSSRSTSQRRLYKLRWRIETAFNRLKDFRRIATRYDKLARNYLTSVCLVAALVWWI
jgi:transposase